MGECLIIRSGGGTDTSGATATAARVLSGYTCYVNDSKITGTMTNQGTKNASLNAGGSYTIPAGYHNGSGKVTANALSGQTSGTAGAAHVLSGKTAWVNGSKLTGTMTNRGAISQKLAANDSYTVPVGWHNGSGKVTQSLTTQGAKTVTPTTSNQTACAASRWTTGSIVILGSSSLKAANIKNGVTIFGVKGTFTGWVDSTMPVSVVATSVTVNTSLITLWDGDVEIILNASFSLANIKRVVSAGFNWIRYNITASFGRASGQSRPGALNLTTRHIKENDAETLPGGAWSSLGNSARYCWDRDDNTNYTTRTWSGEYRSHNIWSYGDLRYGTSSYGDAWLTDFGLTFSGQGSSSSRKASFQLSSWEMYFYK